MNIKGVLLGVIIPLFHKLFPQTLLVEVMGANI